MKTLKEELESMVFGVDNQFGGGLNSPSDENVNQLIDLFRTWALEMVGKNQLWDSSKGENTHITEAINYTKEEIRRRIEENTK